MKENKKIIKGRGKIHFHDEKDRERMNKKYPELKFEKMNPLTFTTTYKGKEEYDLVIKVGNTEIPCSFKKFAWPWKYGTKVELRLHFKDLKKKAITHITGGIQGKLFQFFRYDYEKIKKDKKGGAICVPCMAKVLFIPKKKGKRGGGKRKRTFKQEKKKENKDYYVCIRKSKKIKDKKTRKKSLIKCNDKRSKKLKRLKKKYPKE